ncbi:phosphate signaling complex protein PhoU [Lachnospiraceae bacterium NSJ-143]|nr:phosphate signaling complex protein PhoU [Lachnospiraceae bacterium NSJ-143]
MRAHFDDELSFLNTELIKMGALCERAVSVALDVFFTHNRELAKAAQRLEKEIDAKERDIEDLCMKLILRQQPVAGDLRLISSAIKMISDMERIGDQAQDIADIAVNINDTELENRIHIKAMSETALKMVTKSVDSFVQKDMSLAESVIAMDDEVDSGFDKIKNELIAAIDSNGLKSEEYIDILMIAKYIERIGDHAVNIAEWVEYSLTGEHRKEDI